MAFRCLWIAAVTAALAGPGLSGAASAAASAHPETKQVNTSGPIPQPATQIPKAGSPDYLAYLVQPTTLGSKVLEVRDVHGASVDYGLTWARTFSLVDGLLTGSSRPPATVETSRSVDWWKLKTKKSGRISIPKHHRYLGAAPGGVLLSTPKGSITRMTLAGKITKLGKLPSAPYRTLTSDFGYVAFVAGSPVHYQTWGHPGSFTSLRTGATDPIEVTCDGMSSTYVGCLVANEKTQLASPVLVRLNGGPLAATSSATAGSASVGGDSVVYSESAGSGSVLGSIAAGDDTPEHSTTPVAYYSPLTAFGMAVFAGTDESLLGATDATHVTTLAPPVSQVAAADEFALAPGRVVWEDNLPASAYPGDPAVVRQRAVHATSHKVSLGKPSAIGGTPGEDPYPHVFADSHATAWEAFDPDGTRSVAATSRYGMFKRVGGLVGVSNRWLATQPSRRTVKILDMKSKATSTIHSVYGIGLSRHWLATVPSGNHRQTALQVTNLTTGHRVTVARSKSRPQSRQFSEGFYFAGNWIGWTDGNHHGHARNVATMKPAVIFHRPIASLGPRDAVLMSSVNLFTSNYYVASYTGHETKVLSKASVSGVPQVDGHVFAWIDALGKLEAGAIKLPK